MPISIVEVAQASHDPLTKGILMQVARTSDVISLLPWVTYNKLVVKGARWQELPTPQFRQYNAGYSDDWGTLDQWTDGVFPFGLDIQIEKQYEDVEDLVEPASLTQAKMALRAVAMDFNYYFIEGDPAAGGFSGLRHRVMDATTPARMRIDLATAGDSLKVLASAANEHTFLDAMHEAVKKLGGRGGAFFMNETTYLGVTSVLRRLGLLQTNKDSFDRIVNDFMGFRLVDIGTRADQSTDIILGTEDPGDGGNDSTSIYGVRFGEPDGDSGTIGGEGVHGVQKNALEVYDPLNGNEMEDQPAYLRRIDWPVTVTPMGDLYSICRIYGFEMDTA